VGIDSEAFSRVLTTCSACSLDGAVFGDGHDFELFHACGGVVELDFEQAGVNHEFDAVNRYRGFGDIGRKNDFS